MRYTAVRIIIILFIIVVSFIVSIKVSSLLKLRNKINNLILYYIAEIVLFNITLVFFGVLGYLILFLSDPFVSWY